MAFADPQKPFTTSVDARYTETWHLDGHVRTGTQVLAFSNKIVAKTPALLVHWFRFEFNSVLYEFKLVGDQTKGIDTISRLRKRSREGKQGVRDNGDAAVILGSDVEPKLRSTLASSASTNKT